MIAALLLTAALSAGTEPPAPDPALHFGRFGEVSVYRPSGTPAAVALFFSGDGGWNLGVVDMARAAAADGTLVLGVDTPRYLKAVDASGDRCSYLAADAEALSQFAQKQLGLPHYQPPLLIGYSSGAGLVYATLAQAPDNTFAGALSIAFDPLIPAQTPLCERNGLTSTLGPKKQGRLLGVVPRLPAPWIVLQGEEDTVSPIDSVAPFVRAVAASKFVRLPRVGHGFSTQSNWLPELKDAIAELTPGTGTGSASTGADLAELPVVELPTPPHPADYFAVVLSGDGGWASIDKQIGEELVRTGVPTVGFNSLQYFWRKRSPEEISADLERIIHHYQALFHLDQVVLIGYSRGADVLPIMASRLPGTLLGQVRLMAFLGLEHETNLEFRLGDWLGAQHDASYRLLPELEKLRGQPMLCVFGSRERDTLCPDLPAGLADIARIEGGHHFDGDFRGLARLILEHVKPVTRSP